nr:hypothetical protein [Crucivirus sp.]
MPCASHFFQEMPKQQGFAKKNFKPWWTNKWAPQYGRKLQYFPKKKWAPQYGRKLQYFPSRPQIWQQKKTYFPQQVKKRPIQHRGLPDYVNTAAKRANVARNMIKNYHANKKQSVNERLYEEEIRKGPAERYKKAKKEKRRMEAFNLKMYNIRHGMNVE